MTAAPQRNFDLPTDERIRAIVAGAPAFARRLRAIEDLEAAMVRNCPSTDDLRACAAGRRNGEYPRRG
jgi:hypothetical protein